MGRPIVPDDSVRGRLPELLLHQETVRGDLEDVGEQGAPRGAARLHLHGDVDLARQEDRVRTARESVALRREELRLLHLGVHVWDRRVADPVLLPRGAGDLQALQGSYQEPRGPDEPPDRRPDGRLGEGRVRLPERERDPGDDRGDDGEDEDRPLRVQLLLRGH